MRELKVGDRVRIVDNGRVCSTYEDFFNTYKNSESNNFEKYKMYKNGTEGVITAIECDSIQDRDLAIVNTEENSFIINIKGLESLKDKEWVDCGFGGYYKEKQDSIIPQSSSIHKEVEYEIWNPMERFLEPTYEEETHLKIESNLNPIFEYKTNKISRINGNNKETIISYEINNNELEVKIEGHMIGLRSLVRIILHETELYKEIYKRISPFKTNRKYYKNIYKHRYEIIFIDVKDNFIQKKITLIETNASNCVNESFKMFKYDFTELAVELGILKRVNNRYELVKSLNTCMNNCTYLKSKPSINVLKGCGFIIPESYKNVK